MPTATLLWLALNAAPLQTAAQVVLNPDLGAATPHATLALRYQLVADPEIRQVLEAAERVVAPEEVAREAQRTLNGALRRFDFAAARVALERAWVAAQGVNFGAEGRALVLELCTLQTQLALLTNDEALGAEAAAFSLSIDSRWAPEERVTPAVRAKLISERERVKRAPVTTRVLVVMPADAKVMVDGSERLPGPLATPATGSVVWVTASGHTPKVVRLTAPRIEVRLEPVSQARRLGPLVAAVRTSRLEARRPAAVALAKELRVDLVLLDDGQRVIEVPAVDTVNLPLPSPTPSWVADGFGASLGIGGALLAGASGALFAVGQQAALDAKAAPTLGDFEVASARARSTRAIGLGLAIGAGVALAAAAVRYVVVFNRGQVNIAVVFAGQSVLLAGAF